MSLRCVAADSIYANNANRKFSMQNVYLPPQTIFVLCKSLYINGEFFE